ncbi:hypothetical protein SARC_13509, partial [Sphaeroforma arctica JP610]
PPSQIGYGESTSNRNNRPIRRQTSTSNLVPSPVQRERPRMCLWLSTALFYL